MKKINLKGISETLNESEMKDVKGGVLTYVDDLDLDLAGGPDGNGATAKPCPPPYRPCNGPHETWVDGGLCCLVPCNGLLHTYGYAVLTGVYRCPW